MKQPILVTYRSVTGFTQQYAQWIAEALGGTCRPLADLSKDDMAAYGTVIFGGRFHAGSVDGLKQAKAPGRRLPSAPVPGLCHRGHPRCRPGPNCRSLGRQPHPEEAARIPPLLLPRRPAVRGHAPGG